MASFSAPLMTDPLVSGLDLVHMPEVYNKLVGQYPKQRELNWIEAMGKYIKVEQTDYYHHEENRIIQAPQIASATNGSGSSVVVTLAAVSHSNGGKYSYPRIGNLVQFNTYATGLITAKDTSVDDAHTITVKPVNASQNVQSGPVAGDVFMVYSTAGDEGGAGLTTSIIPTTTKMDNQVQIFRGYFAVTSSEQTNKTWFTMPGENGEDGNYYYIKGEMDEADRFRLQEELGLFITPKSDASLTDAAGNAVRTTRALIPHLQAYSNQLTYSSTPTLNLYDSIVKTINKNYGVSEYIMGQGLNFALENTKFIADFMKNGAIIYNSFGGSDNGSKKAIELGFSSMAYGGYTFHTKKWDILSHADTTGASGFPYADMCIMIPMGKGTDPKSGKDIDYFAVRYKQASGAGARTHYKVWQTGGNSEAGTDTTLKRQVNYASEKGIEVFGANKYIQITKV